MKELVQKKNFVTRKLRYTDSKLFYEVSKFGNGNEVDIPFENIDGEKVNQKATNHFLLILAIILYAIAIGLGVGFFNGGKISGIAVIAWLLVASLILFAYFYSRERFWKIRLSNDSYLYIHQDIPDAAKVNLFLNGMLEARNAHLLENYGQIDENLPYESQLNNLKWLKSTQVLSKKAFEEKYAELKRTVKPEKKDIGFGK